MLRCAGTKLQGGRRKFSFLFLVLAVLGWAGLGWAGAGLGLAGAGLVQLQENYEH